MLSDNTTHYGHVCGRVDYLLILIVIHVPHEDVHGVLISFVDRENELVISQFNLDGRHYKSHFSFFDVPDQSDLEVASDVRCQVLKYISHNDGDDVGQSFLLLYHWLGHVQLAVRRMALIWKHLE